MVHTPARTPILAEVPSGALSARIRPPALDGGVLRVCTSTPAMRLQAPDRPLGFPTPPLLNNAAGSLAVASRTHRHRHSWDPDWLAPSPYRAHSVCCQSVLCLVTVAAASDNGLIPKSGIEHGCPATWTRSGNYARRAGSLYLCVSANHISTTLRAVPAPHVVRQPPSHRPPRHPSAQPARGVEHPPWGLQPPRFLPTRVGRCSTALTPP